MNILAISHLFPKVGDERYGIFVARQLSAMHNRGAEINAIVPVVWCPRVLRHFNRWKDYNHQIKICKFEGIEAIGVPYIRPSGNWYNRWSGLAVFRAIRKKALKLHKKKNFDIIYATDFFPDGDAAVRLAKYLKLPVACLAIGVDVNITAHSSKIIHRHFVKTARALDGTLACGQSVADGIDAVTGKRSLCVYGVVDLNQFSPAADKISLRKEIGLPADKLVALYAGYIQKRKGIYEMLEAFSRIQKIKPDVLLCVCGSGEEECRFTQMVREKNLEHIIRIIGEVEPEKMSKWMKASDLFVLATHTEGMPNVVMEAMACGLPVVTTTVGGLPGAIGDCEGAILVPPKNVDRFKDAVLRVIEDKELRKHMALAARKRAEERFGIQQSAQRIMDYLTEVIEKTKLPKSRK